MIPRSHHVLHPLGRIISSLPSESVNCSQILRRNLIEKMNGVECLTQIVDSVLSFTRPSQYLFMTYDHRWFIRFHLPFTYSLQRSLDLLRLGDIYAIPFSYKSL